MALSCLGMLINAPLEAGNVMVTEDKVTVAGRVAVTVKVIGSEETRLFLEERREALIVVVPAANPVADPF